MSYQSIVKPIMQFLSHFEQPQILEIGVDKGQTAIPLCHNLTLLERPFLYDGIDILVQESVINILTNMSRVSFKNSTPEMPFFNTRLFEENSLDFLPKLIEVSAKYNLILLDGDHNYHTVYSELAMLDRLTLPSTLIICDDYNTRWSDKDLFYSEREEYSDVRNATPRTVRQKKKGVKPAIEDFIEQSGGKWASTSSPFGDTNPLDFCILYQPEAILNMNMLSPPGTNSMNQQILEVYFNKQKCPEVKDDLMKNIEYVYSRKGDK